MDKKKDLAVVTALAELGLRKEKELSPEEEEALKRALDPEEQFLDDVQRLFTHQPED